MGRRVTTLPSQQSVDESAERNSGSKQTNACGLPLSRHERQQGSDERQDSGDC